MNLGLIWSLETFKKFSVGGGWWRGCAGGKFVVHSEFSVLLWSKALVLDLRPGPSWTILKLLPDGYRSIRDNWVIRWWERIDSTLSCKTRVGKNISCATNIKHLKWVWLAVRTHLCLDKGNLHLCSKPWPNNPLTEKICCIEGIWKVRRCQFYIWYTELDIRINFKKGNSPIGLAGPSSHTGADPAMWRLHSRGMHATLVTNNEEDFRIMIIDMMTYLQPPAQQTMMSSSWRHFRGDGDSSAWVAFIVRYSGCTKCIVINTLDKCDVP